MNFALTVLFILSSVIQIYFWWYQIGQLFRIKRSPSSSINNYPSVAILISVKNELEHIKAHWPLWVDQKYSNFKVYIINDGSTDGTLKYIQRLEHPSIISVDLPEGIRGKKRALSHVIGNVNAEWLLFTDADCYPDSNEWLAAMMRHHESSDVILGYSPYLNKCNTFLERLIQYESWYIAAQYMSASVLGRTYMGVGRNMAFKKHIYIGAGGYEKHIDLPGGDDDLFIASLPQDTRYTIVTESKSWVWTYPKSTFWSYFQQKRRHLTTAPKYRLRTKLWLIGIYLSQAIWYTTVIILSLHYPWMLFFLFLRGILLMSFTYRPKSQSGLSPLFRLSLLYDVLLFLVYTGLSVTYLFPKKSW